MTSHLPATMRRLVEPIRLFVTDVDGVLTDGSLLYTDEGESCKRFCVRDGLALHLLCRAGIAVGIISGRRSPAVTVRCRELGIRDEMVIQGSRDKAGDLELLEKLVGVEDNAVAAMGDDLPDLPLLQRVGFAACPADAVPEVAAACHLICGASGGAGAVREVAELILKAQARWQELVAPWHAGYAEGEDTSE
ncbi:MAG: HAD hydrolase family protein [Acidobacteria bacterium]|jgi:3-deoxy-D-manno-octulosonate 8-phosphate phosphatase (KDO 8-P phosphatase)|nr:HAD hydrolase family protein [Acidobacteriota bacterium]